MHTIHTIGGGEFIRDFFNGVAILSSSGIYVTALKIMIVIGVIWYGFQASNGALKEAFKWVVTVVLMMYVMLFAKASVVIEDKANVGLAGNKIDNVPFGLAVIAGVASSIGEHLTSGFEQMFSLPNDMQYSENGLILGARTLEKTSNMEIASITKEQVILKANLQEFMIGCVIPNIQMEVPYTKEEIKASTNLWSLIKDKSGLSPIFTFSYKKSNGTKELLTCKDGIDLIESDLNNNKPSLVESLAQKLFPTRTKVDAVNHYNKIHTSVLSYLTKASQTAQDNLIQAIMVNEFNNAVAQYGRTNGMSGLTPYEEAKMDLQRQSTYRVIGAKANSWLTNTKTLFEAMMYAIFPIVVLFIVAPFGGIKIFVNYIMVFAWLTLWGPCFAVVNMIANYSDKLQTGEVFGYGLTIANQIDVLSVQAQVSSMAGYFTMLVPFLALFVFQGLGAMSSMAHKLGGIMEGTASQVASESTTGNISVGNTSFNNIGANKQDMSSFFKGEGHSVRVDSDGLITKQTASGIRSYDGVSEVSSKLNTSFGLSDNEVSSLSSSVSQIESMSNNKAISKAVSNGFQVGSTDGYSRSQMDSIADSMNYAKNMSSDLSESTGLSQSQVMEASAKIKGGMSIAGFGAEFGGGLSGSTTSSDAFKKLQSFSESERFDTAFSYMQKNAMNESISYTDSHGNTKTSTIEQAMRVSEDYSKQISNSKQFSSIQNTGKTDDYVEFVENHYGSENAKGIFNHRDHSYDNIREDSFKQYSEYTALQNNNYSNNQSKMNEMEYMVRMKAESFDNNHSSGMKEIGGGYSNSDLKGQVETMMSYTDRNVQNEKDRFENKIESEGEKIESKANENVGKASYGAVKRGVNDLIDGNEGDGSDDKK